MVLVMYLIRIIGLVLLLSPCYFESRYREKWEGMRVVETFISVIGLLLLCVSTWLG